MSDTLDTVWATGALLGVRCHGCDHRAVLSPAELPPIRRGNCRDVPRTHLCRRLAVRSFTYPSAHCDALDVRSLFVLYHSGANFNEAVE